MDSCSDENKLEKFIQEKKRSSNYERHWVVKNLTTHKILGPEYFTSEFYQTFKQHVVPDGPNS